MPIIKSAKKAMRQAAKRQKRNYNTRAKYKKAMREVEDHLKAGKVDEAKKALSGAQKTIDMAEKKNILHKNNAARKKARMARVVASAEKK